MLSKADVERYRETGYLVVPDVLERETLDALRRVTAEIVAGAAGLTDHTDVLDLEETHTPEAPRVRRIKRPHLAHPFFRDLAGHAGIMAVLEPLIGPNIRLRAGGKVNMKSAGYGAPVEWHQDWAFYPHTNGDVLAVGILLDDMTPDNGPVMFLPGSHRGEVYDHHSYDHEGAGELGAFCGAINLAVDPIDLSTAEAAYGTAGSITVHDARLVHGSAMNRSNEPRRVLFYEYAAADAWPLAGVESMRDLDEFNSRIVLGTPTLRPRVEPVPVRMPLPIAKFQGSIYENQRTLDRTFFDHDADRQEGGLALENQR